MSPKFDAAPGPQETSMVRGVMGADFTLLDAAVQRFHLLAGRHTLHGWVETGAPQSLAAKLLGLCLGTPLKAQSGPIRFELDAAPRLETWTRHFPSQTMRSQLRPDGHYVVETLGLARLSFELRQTSGQLGMHLSHMRFMGITCPRWLMPRVVAEETGQGDMLHFNIVAELPLVGRVVSYQGHLALANDAEGCQAEGIAS